MDYSTMVFNTGYPPEAGTYIRKAYHFWAKQTRYEKLFYSPVTGWEVNRRNEKYIGWLPVED